MVVVLAETIVQWRKEHRDSSVVCPGTLANIQRHYVPSTKISRGGHRRRSPAGQPLVVDETLGLKVQVGNDSKSTEIKMKGVILSLNKLSPENVKSVLSELETIDLHVFEQVQRAASVLYQRTLNENVFRQSYLDLVEKLRWRAIRDEDDDKICFAVRDLFVIEVQKSFETIRDMSKDQGCRVMQVIGELHPRGWVSESVFDDILDFLLEQQGNVSLEYAIVLLKACPALARFEDLKKDILTRSSLPLRLRMLLE